MKKQLILILIFLLILTGCNQGNRAMLLHPYPYSTLESLDRLPNVEDIKQLEPISKDIWTKTPDYRNEIELDLNITTGLLINLESNEALYAYNIFDRIIPASITKIMTALLVVEYGNLDEEVEISHNFDSLIPNAKRSGIKKGDILTLEQLLYGLMINSGNDCAIAIAEHISGSVEQFSILMNNRAKELGAKDTNFMNPHGLNEDNHYSTAYDLYLIFNEVLKSDLLKHIMNQSYTRVTYKNSESNSFVQTWYNTNQFLHTLKNIGDNSLIYGGKTGFVTASGYNLILLSYINEEPIFSLIIGSKTREDLYEDMLNLLNAANESMN